MHADASQLTIAAVNVRGSCATVEALQALEDAILAKLKEMPSLLLMVEADARTSAVPRVFCRN